MQVIKLRKLLKSPHVRIRTAINKAKDLLGTRSTYLLDESTRETFNKRLSSLEHTKQVSAYLDCILSKWAHYLKNEKKLRQKLKKDQELQQDKAKQQVLEDKEIRKVDRRF